MKSEALEIAEGIHAVQSQRRTGSGRGARGSVKRPLTANDASQRRTGSGRGASWLRLAQRVRTARVAATDGIGTRCELSRVQFRKPNCESQRRTGSGRGASNSRVSHMIQKSRRSDGRDRDAVRVPNSEITKTTIIHRRSEERGRVRLAAQSPPPSAEETRATPATG